MQNVKWSSGDKYLDFLIQNYKSIKAFEEIVRYAKNLLASYVDREATEAIKDLKYRYFERNGLKVDEDNGIIFWYDPDFTEWDQDLKKGKGPVIQYESEQVDIWKWIESEDQDEAPYLYCLVDVSGIKKIKNKNLYNHEWAQLLNRDAKILSKKGISIQEEISWGNLLAYWILDKEITMEKLADREQFRKAIQRAVRNFTDALLPILRKGQKISKD